MTAAKPLLLDTCAVIFLSLGRTLTAEAVAVIDASAKNRAIQVSVLSALEIGQSAAKGRLALTQSPYAFFTEFLSRANAFLCDMATEAMIASSFLPGRIHKDPVDRALVALARHHDLTLVTSDRDILAYGALGHVKTLNCLD